MKPWHARAVESFFSQHEIVDVIGVQNHCNRGWLDDLDRNHRKIPRLFCIRQHTHTYHQLVWGVRVHGYRQPLDACEHLALHPQERLHRAVAGTATTDTRHHRAAPSAAPLPTTKMRSQNKRYRECHNASERCYPQHS